jgi:crotonobetainyl-CoA:carnitine CoA-transferase CaiB-like acyl-CoA transferase
VIAEWVAQRSRDDILGQLVAAEVPVAPVADMAALAVDPHLLARQMVVSIDDPELGHVRMPGVVPRLSQSPGSIRSAAPAQGSSNEEVYSTMLGLPPSEVARLKSSGTI